MKQMTMFDLANPLGEELCNEISGGDNQCCGCSCAWVGSGGSTSSDNYSANDAQGSGTTSCYCEGGPGNGGEAGSAGAATTAD
jgi:hypothetical protein